MADTSGGIRMNELIQTSQNGNGEITLSGRELHEFLDVKSNYSTWFERMTEYGFVEDVDYVLLSNFEKQNGSGGHNRVDHQIKLDMAKEIAMIQRTEKGKEARQYFLQVEKAWNSPEMIIKRAMEFQNKKILFLETKIHEEKPYTDFGKVVAICDGAINVGAFAKLIYEKHGINIGRNKLMEWLREKGYLIKQGREKNNPKQNYIEQGLFKISPTIISRTEGDVQSNTTLVTGKGQVKLMELLNREFGKGVLT
jgi:anti-repressor protein